MSDETSVTGPPLSVESMLNLAITVANLNARGLHERWVKAQHGLHDMPSSMQAAFSCMISFDLLLRQLERERQPTVGARGVELMHVDQIFFAMSEAWMSQVYEILRVTSSRAKVRGAGLTRDLEAVKHAAGLVRMGVAKGEVADMHSKKKQSAVQIQLQNSDGEIVPDYINDGSWIIPRGVRTASGSCMWWCIDVSAGVPQTVEVCRQEISNLLVEAIIAASKA
jgi:hypothetical protein